MIDIHAGADKRFLRNHPEFLLPPGMIAQRIDAMNAEKARLQRAGWSTHEIVFDVPPHREESLRIRECDKNRVLCLAKTVALSLEKRLGPDKAARAYYYTMNLAKLDRCGLATIYPGTPEWDAWLAHHRGTKTEARMLACMAQGESFYAASKFPPDAPRLDQVTRDFSPLPSPAFPERRGVGDGEVGAIADRLLARTARSEAETAELKKRRKLERTEDRIREDALAAARENRRPNVDGSEDIGVVSVADPSESETLVSVGKGPPMRIANEQPKLRKRVVALRDDPVGKMATCHQLDGDPDYDSDTLLRGARKYEKIYEATEIGHLRGLDPSYDVVDGGAAVTDISAGRLDAVNQLNELSQRLGRRPARLLRQVLGEKRTLRQVAEMDGKLGVSPSSDGRTLDYYGRCFREALHDLAAEFKLSVTGKQSQRPRDRFDEAARYAYSAPLHEAVERDKRLP